MVSFRIRLHSFYSSTLFGRSLLPWPPPRNVEQPNPLVVFRKYYLGCGKLALFLGIRRKLVLSDDLFHRANDHGSRNDTAVLIGARVHWRECRPKVESNLPRCFFRLSNCWSWSWVGCGWCNAVKVGRFGNGMCQVDQESSDIWLMLLRTQNFSRFSGRNNVQCIFS